MNDEGNQHAVCLTSKTFDISPNQVQGQKAMITDKHNKPWL